MGKTCSGRRSSLPAREHAGSGSEEKARGVRVREPVLAVPDVRRRDLLHAKDPVDRDHQGRFVCLETHLAGADLDHAPRVTLAADRKQELEASRLEHGQAEWSALSVQRDRGSGLPCQHGGQSQYGSEPSCLHIHGILAGGVAAASKARSGPRESAVAPVRSCTSSRALAHRRC